MNEERFAPAEAVLREARMPASGEDLEVLKRSYRVVRSQVQRLYQLEDDLSDEVPAVVFDPVAFSSEASSAGLGFG